jgi:hypothetical protein
LGGGIVLIYTTFSANYESTLLNLQKIYLIIHKILFKDVCPLQGAESENYECLKGQMAFGFKELAYQDFHLCSRNRKFKMVLLLQLRELYHRISNTKRPILTL